MNRIDYIHDCMMINYIRSLYEHEIINFADMGLKMDISMITICHYFKTGTIYIFISSFYRR